MVEFAVSSENNGFPWPSHPHAALPPCDSDWSMPQAIPLEPASELFWEQWGQSKQDLRVAVDERLRQLEQLITGVLKQNGMGSARPETSLDLPLFAGGPHGQPSRQLLATKKQTRFEIPQPDSERPTTPTAIPDILETDDDSDKKGKTRKSERRLQSFVRKAVVDSDRSYGSLSTKLSMTRQIDDEREPVMPFLAQRLTEVTAWWQLMKEPERTGLLARTVSSSVFAFVCMGVIVLNALYITYAADKEMLRAREGQGDGADHAATVFESLFLAFYGGELILKFVVHRFYFFCNDSMGWNLFDACLVLLSAFDFIAQHASSSSPMANNMTFARLLRLMKLGKVFRIFRTLRFLTELRVMVLSILGSGIALFWSLVMLTLILFVFGLLFIQIMSGYLIEEGDTIGQDLIQNVVRFFGSVSHCMLTLLMCSFGGVDWNEVYELISLSGAFGAFLFIFFLAFFEFSVLNILTGIFLEKAFANSQPDRESLLLQQRRTEDEYVFELTVLLKSMDDDSSGTITYDEFLDHSSDKNVQLQLSFMGLNVKDAAMFFRSLAEVNGSTELWIDDFVGYCSKMKGSATAVDLNGLAFQVRLMERRLMEHFEVLEGSMGCTASAPPRLTTRPR